MKVAKYFNPTLYEIIDLSFDNGKTKKIYTTLSFKAFEHSIWETVFPTGFKDATFNFVLRMYHCYCHLWSNEYLIAFFLQYIQLGRMKSYSLQLIIRFEITKEVIPIKLGKFDRQFHWRHIICHCTFQIMCEVDLWNRGYEIQFLRGPIYL